MKIEREADLTARLERDVHYTTREKIILVAGHFPLRAERKTGELTEDFSTWGDFSPYTLLLGARVAKYIQELGKEARFLLLCDDHSYKEMDKQYLREATPELTEAQLDNRWRSQRDALYRQVSGKEAAILPIYKWILGAYNFSEKDILRHNHSKEGRHDCLYYSENVLRASLRSIENNCAREYVELLESEQIQGGDAYLISFLPQKCFDNICLALDDEVEVFEGTHIFMPTGSNITRENIYTEGRGVTYRHDKKLGDKYNSWLDRTLDDLWQGGEVRLSTPTVKVLEQILYPHKTLRYLRHRSWSDIKKMSGVGQKRLAEMKKALQAAGIQLRD